MERPKPVPDVCFCFLAQLNQLNRNAQFKIGFDLVALDTAHEVLFAATITQAIPYFAAFFSLIK